MSSLFTGVEWYASNGGAGNLTVGAPKRGCLTPLQASVPDGTSGISYRAVSGVQSEWGLCTYNKGVITRDTVLGNSQGTTSPIAFAPPPVVSFEDVQATDISGGGGSGISLPLPFFGNSNPPWNGASQAPNFTSWLNQGSSTVTAVTGGPLVVQGNALSGSLPPSYISAIMRTLPSPPYTITIGIAAVSVLGASEAQTGNTPNAPIVLYDSTTDTAYVLTAWASISGAMVLRKITTASVPASSSVSSIGNWYGDFAYFGWFQVQNDGTNISLSYSAENLRYFTFFKDTIANFGVTFNRFGIGNDLALIPQAVGTLTPHSNSGSTIATIPLWNFTQTSP